MKGNKKSLLSYLVVTFFFILISHTFLCKVTKEAVIPKEVNKFVAKHFKGWKIASVDCLSQEDRSAWEESKGSLSPGFARGKFRCKECPDTKGYFCLLVPKKFNSWNKYKIIYLESTGKSSIELIWLETYYGQVNSVVIWAEPPINKLEDIVTGEVWEPTYDVLYCESLGAGMIVIFWDGIEFREILLSY